MLHEDDIKYFDKIKTIGLKVAEMFDINVKIIEPKRRPSGAYGLACCEESRISILIREKAFMYDGGAWSTKRLPDREVKHTLGHELAHLLEYQRYGKTNHGERFRGIESMLVEAVNKVEQGEK